MQLPISNPEVNPQVKEVSLKDLAEILIKHFGFHEGIYDVGVQFNFVVGQVGVTPTTIAPGALISVVGVGISKVLQQGLGSVDASQVNPLKPKRRLVKPKD